jgi:hypothetical protein
MHGHDGNVTWSRTNGSCRILFPAITRGHGKSGLAWSHVWIHIVAQDSRSGLCGLFLEQRILGPDITGSHGKGRCPWVYCRLQFARHVLFGSHDRDVLAWASLKHKTVEMSNSKRFGDARAVGRSLMIRSQYQNYRHGNHTGTS